MRILRVETIPLRYDLPRTMWDAHLVIRRREALIVRIVTDQEIEGLGESATFGGAMSAVEAVVLRQLAPLIEGEDPLLIEAIWRRMFDATVHLGRVGVVMAAISGVDIALWDIASKAAGLPLYRMLGGFRERLQPYASGGFYSDSRDTAALADEVLSYRERGFTAAKIKVGAKAPVEDAGRVADVRRAVGDRFGLMVDANCGYSATDAVAFSRRVGELDIAWIEEPVRVDDIAGSARVVREGGVPVAGYESESSREGFHRLLVECAVDIVQADAIWAGGITNVRRIADLADAYHKPFVPHVFSSAVSLAANMHLLASRPNGGSLEFDGQEHPLRDEIVANPISVSDDGLVCVGERPGLGVELEPEALARYRVES